MPTIIGIDLGTTNTAVAVLEDGRPRVIEDDRGYKVLPSVVSAKGDSRFVVGQAAHNLILTRPDRTVYAVKRLLGRRFDSAEVQGVRKRVGYEIKEGPDGGVQVQVGDAWMSPQEVAAVILQVARGIAEKSLGRPVDEAVITVPAHFNHAQRKATLEAAEIAGLPCKRLLNEPTAAALAYGHRKNVDRTLVIFDLGGGTFDVSVLRLSSGIYEILSTNGDTFLGGEDFDYRLVDHIADEFKAESGVDLRLDQSALQRVKDAAERAKCELSFSDRATIVVPHAAPGRNLETVLTRSQLELLTRDLVEKCVTVAREAVADAALSMSDIDDVILVGGQTRMPAVREAVAGLFGREASRSVHPEEAVAVGAAVHAASLGDVEGIPAILLDVTPFDLGIDAAGGLFSKIVLKNSKIPCNETRTFATVRDDQPAVRVTVRQGESRTSEDNEFLGEFLFEGLTPAPRMQTKVAVTFRIDANGMLHVAAVEPGTGEKRNISIRNYADRSRSVLRPDAPPGTAAAAGLPAESAAAPAKKKKKKSKKKGLLEQIFGSSSVKSADPVSKASAGPPAPTIAAEAGATPTIAALPPAPEASDELADDLPEEIEATSLSELEDDDAFVMPADLDEDELYDPLAGPVSFGLAGAHQVGAAAAAADPFGDLGGDREPNATLAPPAPGYRGDAAPEDDLDALLGEDDLFASPLEDEDLFATPLDSDDLFAVPLDDETLIGAPVDADDDPPTDPGAPVRLDDGNRRTSSSAPALHEEDLFGFALADLAEEGPADLEPATSLGGRTLAPKEDATEIFTRGAKALDDDDDLGFTFPEVDEPRAPEPKKRKPARVKLQYRERDPMIAEYRNNLRRGGALIRTEKPLPLGRECLFEVTGPGLDGMLVIPARVSRVVSEGMEVEYVLSDADRDALLVLLGR